MNIDKYHAWLTQVAASVNRMTDGLLEQDDLPDVFDLAAAFEDELSADEAAKELLSVVGWFAFTL